jgi:predicted Zn finger-like uncharacterized protein
MKVTCQACSAQYTIADDKVKGRKVKIRCKACQSPIVVDGQNPAPDVGSGTSEAPPALDPFAPETAVAGDADVWNVNLSDTDSRTMATAEVIEGFRSGLVTADAFVWKDGMGDWVPIMECVELAPLLSGPTDPPAPVAGATPMAPAVAVGGSAAAGFPASAAKVGGMPILAGGAGAGAAARAASSKAQASADLFGDIDVAGSEADDGEVATSARPAPILPGASAYDDKPTGQRNENSVLFSLDSLKAGFVGGAPAAAADRGSKPSAPKPGAPGAPRATQPSNPDDPFGMGASAGIAGLGVGGSPLFSLNANQALLTAPAPPEPKPIPIPDYSSAAGMAAPAGLDKKTKQLVMFGGIGAGALILLLLGLLVFRGGKDKPELASNDVKSQASGLPEQKPAQAEVKPEEKPAPPAPAASDKKPEEPKAEDKAATKVDPSKSTSKSVAAPPPKKEDAAAPGPSTAPPFSKASAISALGGAAGQSGGCKKAGGPTGVGKVQVTFAPSGRVTSATVMGPPFAGTAVGGCVAGAFRRAHVPAFSGNAVTVSKSFMIN